MMLCGLDWPIQAVYNLLIDIGFRIEQVVTVVTSVPNAFRP